MSNLNKRILTSFPLLIIAIYAIYNNIILVLSLFIISSILIYEFSNIVKNIFKKNKTNSFIFLNLFIFYICLFASQIYFFLIFFTLLISLVSQLGDLFISYLKRKANIKDTGNFLPGHGGLLDRLDGIIFAIPLGIKIFIFF